MAPLRRGVVLVVTLSVLAAVAVGCSSSSDSAGDSSSSDRSSAKPTTTAASGSTTTTAPAAELFTSGDFYQVPAALPKGPHGTLIRYQKVTPTIVKGATTWRIMYTSESVPGKRIAVTGTALVPDAKVPASAKGAKRDVLTIAHGTTGIADQCAPSKDPGSELLLLSQPIANGWLVAQTDYEGLGTPGRHPYLVGESEGRSVLDAARAASVLPNAHGGTQLGIAGYSQGGHGALWANQIAPTWTPEYHVVGTFAGAPATEMQVIMRGGPAGFLIMFLAGLKAAHPEVDLASYLTPAALAKLDSVDTGCAGEVFSAISGVNPVSLPDAIEKGPWIELADADDPGAVKTADPILIIHSEADNVVPIVLSQFLMTRMCKAGNVVERRVLHDGDNHGQAAVPAYAQAVPWFEDRFSADPPAPTDGCPAT